MCAAVVVVDSVTALTAAHSDAVIVSGSHGGLIAARYASAAGVRAAIFNDAGGGLDDAGTAGLDALASIGVPAVSISNASARIGDGADSLARGVVSRANAPAIACGVAIGIACREAVERLRGAPPRSESVRALDAPEGRFVLRPRTSSSTAIIALDSVGLVEPCDAHAILIIGSHGGLHGGDPRSALGVDAHAAFFHDAGRGRDDAGVTRLGVLAHRGIAAGAVDHRSARIGDARSMRATGILSCVNAPLEALAVTAGMSVEDAIRRLDIAQRRRSGD
jgi:hypothetical protein